MPKFKFAYKRVLEFRRLQESWAKDALLEVMRCRRVAELVAEKILQERDKAMMKLPRTIEEMKTLDFYFERLASEYENQLSVISILVDDESRAHTEWVDAKKRLKAMERLHEIALAKHKAEVARAEQNDLDEWANFRRAA